MGYADGDGLNPQFDHSRVLVSGRFLGRAALLGQACSRYQLKPMGSARFLLFNLDALNFFLVKRLGKLLVPPYISTPDELPLSSQV